jgi:hypothetical protein
MILFYLIKIYFSNFLKFASTISSRIGISARTGIVKMIKNNFKGN